MGIMRTLQIDERPTRLAQAIAEVGRIDKTIYTLNFIDDEMRRRSTLQQQNSAKAGTACHAMSFMASAVNFTNATTKARRIS